MAPLDFLIHLLNFVMPAVVVGALVAFAAPSLLKSRSRRSRWRQSAVNAAAGAVALVAGLVFFGNDGKMATYAAMLALIATSQWLAASGGKR
jgi:hypothetical protein